MPFTTNIYEYAAQDVPLMNPLENCLDRPVQGVTSLYFAILAIII